MPQNQAFIFPFLAFMYYIQMNKLELSLKVKNTHAHSFKTDSRPLIAFNIFLVLSQSLKLFASNVPNERNLKGK